MNNIDNYIAKQDSDKAKIIKDLRSLIISNYPQLQEEFKWGQPVYSLNGKGVVYLTATKNTVNLGFNNGAHLDDPKELLEGTGKDMRHIKLNKDTAVDSAYFKKLIDQAITREVKR